MCIKLHNDVSIKDRLCNWQWLHIIIMKSKISYAYWHCICCNITAQCIACICNDAGIKKAAMLPSYQSLSHTIIYSRQYLIMMMNYYATDLCIYSNILLVIILEYTLILLSIFVFRFCVCVWYWRMNLSHVPSLVYSYFRVRN
jgi:hypothetical protein